MTSEGDARRALLGPAAVEAARRIAEEAPALSAVQDAALAALLRSRVTRSETTADAA